MSEVVKAFRLNGGSGKAMYLQAQVSFDETYDAALEGAWDQWRMSLLPSDELVDAATAEEIDRLSSGIEREAVAGRVRVSADLDEHRVWLQEDEGFGFDAVYIHNVNRRQRHFIEAFGSAVIPEIRRHQ
jgi:coenzyme F420-dependent glucose-6-phosphate dehydrogenase